MVSISATLIVRNEEQFLAACLASIQSVVDEIIVVDTGSTDQSRDIARQFGVRLTDFPWIENFSAARNAAIEQARCDWMLYIDADERVRPLDRANLDRDLSDASMVAATVRFYPRIGFTAYNEYRLLRRYPGIRFHGAIHESFLPDVNRMVSAGTGRIGMSAMVIDHVGYEGDQSHKLDRNLNLLLKQIEVSPRRPYLRWHLGTVLRDFGRPEQAEESWREGVRLGLQAAPPQQDAALCSIELAKAAILSGRDPSTIISDGLKLHPGNHMLQWLNGGALLAAGDFIRASPIFETLAAVDPATLVDLMSYDSRIFGASALQELAEDAFAREDYVQSAAFFARAVERDPGRLELRAKLEVARAQAGLN